MATFALGAGGMLWAAAEAAEESAAQSSLRAASMASGAPAAIVRLWRRNERRDKPWSCMVIKECRSSDLNFRHGGGPSSGFVGDKLRTEIEDGLDRLHSAQLS